MYIKDIISYIKHGLVDRHYRSVFSYRKYFLEYCLWKHLRKIKFETDGTFDIICIQYGTDCVYSKIFPRTGDKVLEISLPFDFDRYDKSDDDQRCRYLLELLQQGLCVAAEVKRVPCEELLGIANQLAENGFVYRWPFKRVTLRDYGLKVVFTSELSTRDYILKLQAYERKNPIPICEGQVARTLPDSIFFSYISKEIGVENGKLLIKNRSYREETLLTIDIAGLLDRLLIIDYPESPYPENSEDSKWFYDCQKLLQYDNYNYKYDSE